MSRQPLFVIDNNDQVRTDFKCTSCVLWKGHGLQSNCMKGKGPEGAFLFFAGMAPGKDDDRIGVPMTGYNGKLFHDYLRKAKISKDKVFITNCLKCCFFEKEPTQTMFNACARPPQARTGHHQTEGNRRSRRQSVNLADWVYWRQQG